MHVSELTMNSGAYASAILHNLKRLMLLIGLTVFAAACSKPPADLNVTTRPAETRNPNGTLAKPDPIVLEDVKWIIVTDADGNRYFALSPEDFLRYERNQLRVIRYVTEADGQLEFYIAEAKRES